MKAVFITIALFFVGIVGLITYSFIDRKSYDVFIEANEGNMEILLLIAAGVIFIGAFGSLFKKIAQGEAKKKWLLQMGKREKAHILSIHDTGITMNNNPVVRLEVETDSRITLSFETLVPRIYIPRPGDVLDIIYDPAHPNDAMLDPEERKK